MNNHIKLFSEIRQINIERSFDIDKKKTTI